MIVLNFPMVLISSLGFGNRHVISNLRSCSWIWHGLSVPGSCWVIFLYLFISLDAYVFVEVYKHCIWRLFKMFSLFSMQNFHTYIYGVYFFFQNKIWWISDCAISINCFLFSQKHFSDLHCYFFICSPYTAFCHCYYGTGYTLDKTTWNIKFKNPFGYLSNHKLHAKSWCDFCFGVTVKF